VIFILFFISKILTIISNKSLEETELSYDNLTTVKEVIEYYKSTYISESESTESGFYMDYFVKFKVMPYDEKDNSNEEYYNNILNDSAKVLGYKSFKMIDNEDDIIIKVICNGQKITSIIINDIEDYFIYMDSQIELKQYVEIENTEFKVTSSLLNSIIENNWENVIDFGTRDSIFDEYYIYVEQGLKVRVMKNQIYNIVFTSNYDENVIDNLFPGIDFDVVKRDLGTPSFESDDVIGYKNDNIYVFFSKNEISVYKNLDIDIDDFLELADKLIDDETDLLDFMNDLTDMWPDYSEYTYSSNSIFIAYPLKGIEIKLNYDDMSGILVYNNIKSSLTKIERYLENTDFVSRLKLDAVFEAEKRRVEEENNQKTLCEEYIESLEEEQKDIIGESLNYNIYADLDSNGYIYSMKFISKDNKRANRELNDSITSFLWLSSDYFLYSKSGKGLYLYNLTDGIVTRVYEGTDDFELKGYKNGILKYDDTEVEFQY
jgi:uncharacterized protein (UPF0335 family)